MVCNPTDVAINIMRAERESREAALRTVKARTPADEIARIAHEEMFEFRRGVICAAARTDGVIFNNNPAYFRDAELAELERLLAAAGYMIASRGSYPPAEEEDAGYTVTLVLSRPNRKRPDPVELADLVENALRNIGQSAQLIHDVRIVD